MSCPENLEYFSYRTIDGDSFGCVLGVNHDGYTQTFGADATYLDKCDKVKTEEAFKNALYAQFSFDGKYIG